MKNLRLVSAAAVLLSLSASTAMAQAAGTPASPAPARATPAAPIPSAPVQQAAPAAPVDPIPPANPKFFTALSPSVDTVNSFLKSLWGYDSSRLWRVMAIQTTPAPGVSKVVVFVADKSPNAKVQSTAFYVTPDGKHAIGDSTGVIPFGAHPFADARDLLKGRVSGATRGAASKDFEIVEFTDLQCPHCKDAQPTMEQIVKDFPKAHVVFQLFPLVDIHPSALKAAAYGVCVQKESNDLFFKYVDGVFDTQEGLTPATEDTVLNAAVKRAGLNSATISACAATPATQDIVKADIKLAEDAAVDQTPLLFVNGRMLPLTQIPYESLKQIIQYQATLDGVDSGASAETLAPKPTPPALTTLPR